MLSEEEIETCKQEARNYIEDIKDIDNAGWLRGLMWYIEQLESDKKKLIEKLEETRNNLEKDRFVGYADEIQEILEIVKGEKNE